MFESRRRHRTFGLLYSLLLFTTLNWSKSAVLVDANPIFEFSSNETRREQEMIESAVDILGEESLEEMIEYVDEMIVINCTRMNWTEMGIEENVTCVNGTTFVALINGSTILANHSWPIKKRRDHRKALPLLAAIIPILVKIAVIALKVIKICIMIAKFILKAGWAALKFLGKMSVKAIQAGLKAGKIVGKYMWKAGKFVLEHSDHIIDPVMDYYQAQEETKRAQAREEQFRQDDLARQREVIEANENQISEDDFKEPDEPEEQRSSAFRGGGVVPDEDDPMPGWVGGSIILTLVAMIVGIPIGAIILVNQTKKRQQRRRRRQRCATTGGKMKKKGGGSKSKSTSKTTKTKASKVKVIKSMPVFLSKTEEE